MSYTKGPWRWVKNADWEGDETNDTENLPALVSEEGLVCWFGNETGYYPAEGIPPKEDDMKIMAAAPELYEIVKWYAHANPREIDSDGGTIALSFLAKERLL